jgi:outer membrane immunogenic protein
MFAWKASGTVLAAVAGLAYSGAVLADGYSAPARYYSPSYSWSGLYVGVNAGAEWGRIDGSLPSAPGFPFNVDLDSRFVLGGHAGYQHQMGNWVLGVEGGYSNVTDSKFSSNPAGASCANIFPCQARIDGIWQVGGRLGYAVDKWMVYGTGGWAQADVITRSAPGIEVASANHDGWFIGGGAEFALTKNVIIGAEYLHYDFSAETQNTTPATTPAGVCPLFCVRRIDPDADVVRARLTFKFGLDEEHRPLK